MNVLDPSVPSAMPEPAPRFDNDEERLQIIERFEPDALEDDPELAAIVKFAAQLCDVPVSQVTLVEDARQRFLVREGIEERETPRSVSFCAHAMVSGDLMEVRDATLDDRFADNALVTQAPGVRFYAGQPLVSDEGAPLGALCAVDLKPRPDGLNDFQREGLAVLAQAVMRRLNARRANLKAQRIIEEREERLRRMIEGVPQIAWSADAQGNFDYFNNRWQETTGHAPPQTADAWEPFIHPEDGDKVFAQWGRCFAEGEPFEAEYRLKLADGSWMWVLAMAVPVAENKTDGVRWFGTLTDIDEVHNALEERDLLANELSHRIKNIFAVVIGLATLKARQAPEHEEFARDLTEVLRSLGRAHEFVRPHEGPVQESLQGLLAALFTPYGTANGENRVRVTGVDAQICPRAATPLALVFHELATNSAKYGALSASGGIVTLEAEDHGDAIALIWREIGGPPVKDKGHRGFGSRLVEMTVAGQLQGSWDRHFEQDGLVAELTMAKAALSD